MTRVSLMRLRPFHCAEEMSRRFENDRINRRRILVPCVHGNRIPEQDDVMRQRSVDV
jgi:hypothetical protein